MPIRLKSHVALSHISLAAFAAAAIVMSATAANAQKKYDAGATDTEVKIAISCPIAGRRRPMA